MKREFTKKIKKAAIISAASASIIIAGNVDNPNELVEIDKHKNVVVEKQKVSIIQKIINYIPWIIRILLILPLWLLGTILLKILAPFKSLFINFIVTFLILSLIYFLIAKLLFKDLKFKDIFNSRSITILLISSLIISILNKVLMLTNEDYRKIMIIIDFMLGFLGLIIALIPLIKLKSLISSCIN